MAGKNCGRINKKRREKTPNKCTTYNNTSSRELKDPLRTVTAEKKDENKQEKKRGGGMLFASLYHRWGFELAGSTRESTSYVADRPFSTTSILEADGFANLNLPSKHD